VGPTISVAYLLAYHKDGGWGAFGGDHLGDSEFVIVDIVWEANAWKVKKVFMSAHWRSSGDRSDSYDYWDLYYWGPARGRPIVVVSHKKHANYNSVERCGNFQELGCAFLGTTSDVEVISNRNVGSSMFDLVGCVPSVTPDIYSGIECFWSKLYFDGWHATSDETWGYRKALDFFEGRHGFQPAPNFGSFLVRWIDGPNIITTAGDYAWEVIHEGGNGTYTYSWECEWDGVPIYCGSDKMFFDYIDPQQNPGDHVLRLRATVTSAGVTDMAQLFVTVSSCGLPECGEHPESNAAARRAPESRRPALTTVTARQRLQAPVTSDNTQRTFVLVNASRPW
jgi:hypothetical protein